MSQPAETRRLALTPRRAVGIACAIVVAALNFYLFTLTNWTMLHGGPGADWLNFTQAGDRVVSGGLYASSGTYAYRYSPLLAYLFSAIGLIGPWAWRGLHLLAALAMPGRWLKVAVLLSWPFWFDVEAGNLVVFTLLLAAWALRGRAWAISGFLVMSLLIPRPLMLPVLAWLLWRHREWWLPFAALFVGPRRCRRSDRVGAGVDRHAHQLIDAGRLDPELRPIPAHRPRLVTHWPGDRRGADLAWPSGPGQRGGEPVLAAVLLPVPVP